MIKNNVHLLLLESSVPLRSKGSILCLRQCDQIRQFLKFLVNKFAYKSSPKDWLLLGY